MRLSPRALATLLATLLASQLASQSWSIDVGAGPAVTATTLSRSQPNVITADHATVELRCASGVDCAALGLALTKGAATVLALGRSPANSNSFQVPAGTIDDGQTMDLTLLAGQRAVDRFSLTAATPAAVTPAAPTTAPADPPATPTLTDLVTTACPSATFQVGYNAAADRGQLVVTPSGQVLARGVAGFDEDDELELTVYGAAQLLPQLKVERSSAFRDFQTVRVVGAGTTVPQQLLARQGALVCSTISYRLSDFAPGQGTVTISAFQNDAWNALGATSFAVAPLYTGMLSLGATRTQVVDPAYKLVSTGAESVIARGDDGDDDLLYALFYTPFVWGKRDLEKPIPALSWYRRINPSIGIVPSDVTDNALVGLTVDLPAGVLLTWGWHFRKVTTIAPESGLGEGSPFAGAAAEIPTAEDWANDQFVAVSVDLRAIVQLFAAAAGGGGGK